MIWVLVIALAALLVWAEHSRIRSMVVAEAARSEVASLRDMVAKARDESEQLRVQLAGCGVAASGGIGEVHLARIGDYGWSASYQQVVDARRELEALRQARDHALIVLQHAESLSIAQIDAAEILQQSRASGPTGRDAIAATRYEETSR